MMSSTLEFKLNFETDFLLQVYHVEITIHGVPIETWSVSKRYKEFLELNDEVKWRCSSYEQFKI